MIIASLILASILPCVDVKNPPVTFAQPGSPNYIAMTHIRRLPVDLCEPLAAAPLVGEPTALVAVPEVVTPLVPGEPGPPLTPFAWTPMDWPPDEISYGSGSWFGGVGGFVGGGGGVVVYAPAVDEPPTWLLALAGLVLWVRRPLRRFLRESKRARSELTIADFTTY